MSAASALSAPHLTEAQHRLRERLDHYLTEQYDIESRSRTLAAAEDCAPLWRAFSQELGLLGAAYAVPEGGQGGGFADHLLILETLGRHLAAEPYLSAMVHAGGLLRRCTGQPAMRERLRRLLRGDVLVVVADTELQSRHNPLDVQCTLTPEGRGWRLDGRKAMVHGAPWADEAIVVARHAPGPVVDSSAACTAIGAAARNADAPSADATNADATRADALALVCLPLRGTPGLQRRDLHSIDGGRANELLLQAVPVNDDQLLCPPGGASALIAQVHDEAALAMGADALGVMDRLLAASIAHARQRHQFGVAIGSFQVLRHRVADMYLALEQARALVHQGTALVDAPALERARGVSSVLVAVTRACRSVGQGAVQIHGGLGITEDGAVGHCFRRATQLAQRFGPCEHHLRRLTALSPPIDTA